MRNREENGGEDGFESDDEGIGERLKQIIDSGRPHIEKVREETLKMVGPAQQIPSKSYSLQPDLITGWKPKIELPKPVPVTFPSDSVEQLTAELGRRPNPEVSLVYLGPRFNNTYSAWKVLELPFPYGHMGELKPVLTDRKFVGMHPRTPEDSPRFDSMFESGNLDAVVQVEERQFDCFMRVDANTAGHLHWFYFKVSNLKPDFAYRINICNFQKGKSLYTRGMKPYMKIGNDKWRQNGEDLTFTKKLCKSYQKLGLQTDEKLYKLSFTLKGINQYETVEIAYCPPYTYTKLTGTLTALMSRVAQYNYLRSQVLCNSFGSLKLPLLTITDSVDQEEQAFSLKQPIQGKIMIFIMGRLHPGQSNGSHMMEGLLNWLCGPSIEASQLRSRCVFKIVPMANPDGVAMGNYRTGLSGRDFNRQFTSPDPELYVEVASLKSFLQKCKWIYQKDFLFLFDLHGHSVKKNVFAYGPQYPINNSKYYQSRLFPRLLSRKTSLFRFYSCIFRIHSSKASTARAVLLRQLAVPFPFTVQASNGFYYDYKQFKDVLFDEAAWDQMGRNIGSALCSYMQIIRQVQQTKENKRKEKELIRMKHHKRHRIQSSYIKNYAGQRPHPLNFTRHNLASSIPKDPGPQQVGLKDILNCMEEEDKQEEINKQCSDDELSEGRSDSQDSADDLSPAQLELIFYERREEIKITNRTEPPAMPPPPSSPIQQSQKKQERTRSEKKGGYVRVMKTTKRTSFMTQCDDDELTKEFPSLIRDMQRVEKPKKPPTIIRRRVGSTSGTPSPTRDPHEGSSAKIINISFDLQPVPTQAMNSAYPEERSRKMKTEVEPQQELRMTSGYKSEHGEPYRRTFMSLQRDMLRKQSAKRTASNFLTMNRVPLKVQHIIGRRVFQDG